MLVFKVFGCWFTWSPLFSRGLFYLFTRSGEKRRSPSG
jgi:hypothetical protein